MQTVDINIWAVLLAAISNMILGSLWYSPVLFGKPWMRYMGWGNKTAQEIEAMKQGVWKSYLGMFIGAFIMAYVFAHILAFAGSASILDGIQGAFWVWLGFIATISLSAVLFEGKPKGLYALNVGYYLVSLIIMSIILTIWA